MPLTKALGAALRARRHLRRRVLDQRDARPLTQKVLQCIVRSAARRAGLKHEGLHSISSALVLFTPGDAGGAGQGNSGVGGAQGPEHDAAGTCTSLRS